MISKITPQHDLMVEVYIIAIFLITCGAQMNNSFIVKVKIFLISLNEHIGCPNHVDVEPKVINN